MATENRNVLLIMFLKHIFTLFYLGSAVRNKNIEGNNSIDGEDDYEEVFKECKGEDKENNEDDMRMLWIVHMKRVC